MSKSIKKQLKAWNIHKTLKNIFLFEIIPLRPAHPKESWVSRSVLAQEGLKAIKQDSLEVLSQEINIK